jgi:putative FmdB family regulatory protein
MIFSLGTSMPIYEYACDSCGFKGEYLQKVSDPRLTDCPQCGKATFNKLVSAAGFQLKGSGWYVTDFRDKGAKPAAGKDAAGKESGAAEKESKPAESKESSGETKKEQSVSGT